MLIIGFICGPESCDDGFEADDTEYHGWDNMPPLQREAIEAYLTLPRIITKPNITNCPNCGAPLRFDKKCEYCGTNNS